LEAEDTFEKQPIVLIVGELAQIEKCKMVVKVCDISYQFDKFEEAITVCFKLFFALNVRYPDEAILPWTFAEHYIFGLKVSPNAPQIDTLINQCDKYLKK
jgi:hypothetical protein